MNTGETFSDVHRGVLCWFQKSTLQNIHADESFSLTNSSKLKVLN